MRAVVAATTTPMIAATIATSASPGSVTDSAPTTKVRTPASAVRRMAPITASQAITRSATTQPDRRGRGGGGGAMAAVGSPADGGVGPPGWSSDTGAGQGVAGADAGEAAAVDAGGEVPAVAVLAGEAPGVELPGGEMRSGR